LSQLLDAPRSRAASAFAEPVRRSSQEVEADVSIRHVSQQRQNIERWAKSIADTADLRSLEEDWDGEGANAPRSENVDRALMFLNLLRHISPEMAPPTVVPGLTGEVILKWTKGASSLHAEICRPDRFEWMLIDSSGKATHAVDDGKLENVLSFVLGVLP
jgi:hypothetical protein